MKAFVADKIRRLEAAVMAVEGDFMSHDPFPPIRAALPAGATTLAVGEAEALPADFRHVRVTLALPGFAAARTFGTEISHPQGPAPATLGLRIKETLQAVAERGEADTVRAIAETGVDLISVGALTQNSRTLDLGLDTTVSA